MNTRMQYGPLFRVVGPLFMLFWALLVSAPAYAQQFDQVISETSETDRVKANKVAVDSAGNRYVFGQFNGNVTFGDGDRSVVLNGTQSDLFIAKYNKEGILQWAKEFETLIAGAGVPSATAAGIDIDEPTNALYVTGAFVNALDIDGVRLSSTDSNPDVYLVRLNASTGAVEWRNHIKGSQVHGVSSLDADSNVVITGKITGIADFVAQFNTSKTVLALTPGGSDMFVAVYSPFGELAFVRQGGGGTGVGPHTGAEGTGVQFGSGGSMTVVGSFAGTVRFDGATPAIPLNTVGSDDGFVARYNSNGLLRYVKQIGSTNSESGLLVAHNTQASKYYVVGGFRGALTIGTTALTSLGENDRFVVRYDALSGAVERVSQIGSNGIDFLQGLATDTLNNLYVTGRFFGPQLTIGTGSGAIQVAENDFTSYIAGMNADLVPLFGQTIHGKFNANHLVAEGNGNLHLAGGYEDTVVIGSGALSVTLPNPTGTEALAVARFRPEPLPPLDPALIYMSAATGGTVSGIAFQDEDVLAFDPSNSTWSLLIDGSDLGLSSTDIDAFEWLSDQSVLMSFNTSLNMTGVGLVGDEDIVRFVPRLLGATTAGDFTMFLDGSAVGLDASSENEDIDAVTVVPEGVVISTQGVVSVPVQSGFLVAGESDLLVFGRNRQWSLYMQGGDIGLTFSSEDINALSFNSNGLHLGTLGDFLVNGANSQGQSFSVSGDASDIVTCVAESLGENTQMNSCALAFDGSANGLSGFDVDAIAGGGSTVMGTTFSDDSGAVEPADGADDVVAEPSRIILPLITRP